MEFLKRATEAHYADFYDDFQNNKELHDFVKRITGWEKSLLLQRQMLRTNVKGAEATAVHCQYLYFY